LIIECESSDYTFWERNIEGQVRLYAEIFEPEYVVIASLKPVPHHVKRRLLNYGINVVDNVYPGGSGEQELPAYVLLS